MWNSPFETALCLYAAIHPLLKLETSIYIDLYPTTDRPTHPPTHSFLVVFLFECESFAHG
jgi:hypothetical protein